MNEPETPTWRDRLLTQGSNLAARLLRPMTRGEGIALFLILVIIAAIGLGEVNTTRKNEHGHEAKEHAAVKLACDRSRTFGPPLIAFLEDAEGKLHTGDLERLVPLNGRPQPVIVYYKDTIPKSCPSK